MLLGIWYSSILYLYQAMKKLVLLGLSLIAAVLTVSAQTVQYGTIEKVGEFNFTTSTEPDFDASLVHLDQRPVPAGEYGNLKEEVMRKRAAFETQHAGQFSNERKTRGLAPNPYQKKGLIGVSALGVPNDNDIAVGNDGKVITAVNGRVRIYDDTLKMLQTKAVSTIFSTVNGANWNSDPRLLYDPVSDRYILVCFTGAISYESNILLAFSQTNDPTGLWHLYKINGAPFNDSTWSDYPILAIDDKELFMTFNMVKDNIGWQTGFRQSVIWQINKSEAYAGNPLQYKLWSDIKYNGVNLRNICPAKYHNPNLGKGMYFVSVKNVAVENDTMFLLHVGDTLPATNSTIDMKVLKTPVKYGFPPNARQKQSSPGVNSYLMTNDARVLAAVYENDRVHFGSNTVNTAYMNAGVMLGYVDGVSTANPTVDASIFSTATREFGYPSMAWMGQNPGDHRMLFSFSHCVTDSFSGTSILYRDAAGNYSDVVSIAEGTHTVNQINDTNQRWGDYSNIQARYNTFGTAYLSNSTGRNAVAAHWVAIVRCDSAFLTNVAAAKPRQESVLYPNPSSSRVSVKFSLTEKQKLQFIIVDMLGKPVNELLIKEAGVGENEFSFDVTPLASGAYILQAIDIKGEAVLQHQFVRQ
ncbi:MAG: hypothetical protein RL660_2603 [Bacteroidota bacterium]|jgi:hypothetical protein